MALLRGFLLTLSLLWVLQYSNYGALAATEDGNITTPITVGSAAALTPTHNTFWISPNKTFALGFLQAASSPSFSLSLFYFDLPQLETTVVWTVNRGQLVSANASLQLTEEGDLVLSDSGAQVWSTSTSGKGVSSAVVSDEGNLVLNGQNSSNIVWQSWDQEPTDTLLPGQSLQRGESLVESKGRYWATMQTDEMFAMYFLGALTETQTANYYWRVNGSGMSTEQAYYNASDGLALYNKTGHQVFLPSSPSTQLQRIVLSESGVLTRYKLSADRRSWNPVIQIPSSICTVIGLCGQYGICNADAQNITNYNCSCPDGFNFLNPNDWFAGCRSNYPLNCNLGTKMTRFAGLRYSSDSVSQDWDYHYYNEATTEDACAQTCNASCSCAAATYDGEYCHLCTLGQVNTGNTLKSLYITYLKTSAYPATNANSSSSLQPNTVTQAGKRKIISTAAAVGIGSALGLACIVGIANLFWWHAKHKQAQNEEDQEGMEGEDQLPLLGGPAYFSYKELRAATNGFNQLLGRGGFGPVYKGVLAGGTLVAIKRLEGPTFGDKQFRAEVRTIGGVHHMNLVRLCGFCIKGHHRMLVYEFMAKGSLNKYIFNDPQLKGQDVIDWQTRFQIVISTARAIKYLHEECQPGIVHCDIKPENILLDEDFNAKVSDFGMAQLVGGEANTGSITSMRGTAGYMAPEWTSSKRITSKADVYSFGIVVLEVMSGRRRIETEVVSASKMELSTWAYSEVVEHCNPLALLDTRLLQAACTSEASSPLPPYPPHLTPEFQRAATVAFWCIHKDPSVRPSMGTVLQILEGLRSVDPPPYPF